MNGYTKLFSSIITSTVWREPKEVKILWITMLALADKYGEVAGSVPGLAAMAGLGVDETRVALLALESPDPDSRTKDEDGRRVRPIDGGWFLINHAKYREMMNLEDRKEYLRKKQAEYRQRKAKKVEDVNSVSLPVTDVSDKSTMLTHSRVQSSETKEIQPEAPAATSSAQVPPEPLKLPFESAEFAEAWATFTKHRSEIKKPLRPTSAKMTLAELTIMGEKRAIAALNYTVAKGWQGVREPDAGLPGFRVEQPQFPMPKLAN